jgi:Glycosyl hydrolases family 43
MPREVRRFRTKTLRPFKRLAIVCAIVITVAAAVTAFERPSSAATWDPVINQDFPDPSIVQSGGTYYAYSTQVSTSNIPVSVSTDGMHWSSATTDAMPVLPSWAQFGFTWSPSVVQDGADQWVMFFAARDLQSGMQCIGRAESTTPAGPFVDASTTPFLCDPAGGGDIDPDVFKDPRSGESFLLWKLNGNVVGEATSLWSVALNTDLEMNGEPRELLKDDQAWQAGNIEGPDMIDVSGLYYLFYDANAYFVSEYAIGYATCESPVGPCSDSPNNPVLTSAGGMLGPGGPSMFEGPSGLEMAFAAWDGTTGYAAGGYRAMYMAAVTFERGIPRFDPVLSDASKSSYWLFGAGGAVDAFGAERLGSSPSNPLAPVAGSTTTADGRGYWTVTTNGAVDAFGDARYLGGMNRVLLSRPIVGMAATSDGRGYWLVGSDGGIFSFGDARFSGSTGSFHLNQPVVGMAADPVNGGYWLVAADGGVFSFDAPFFGSTGGLRLNKSIVGIAATPDGGGYWLVASDGGVFSFGDAAFFGSTGNLRLNKPVVGMAGTPDGKGYWLVSSDGGVFSFGDAGFAGSTGDDPSRTPVVAIDSDPAAN